MFFLVSFVFIFNGYSQNNGINQKEPVKNVELSLEEVSKLALVNNFDIQIARYQASMSQQDLGKAQAIFDTFLNLNASYYDDQTKKSTTLLGTKNIEHTYLASLQKKMPTGTTITLEASQSRNWSNSAFASLNPSNEAKASVSLTQSIGENFFGLKDRLDIKQTRLDIENAKWLSLNNIEKSLGQVQITYWSLVLKNRSLKIKKDMLDKAERLYQVYKDRYSRGLTESPDLYATQANLELRNTDVSTAELEKETAKNDLLFLLNEKDTNIDIVPEDELEEPVKKVNLAQELKKAIKNRRDYKMAKNEIESNNLDLIMKRNSLWPQIDLTASFARNGLTGEYKESWGNVSEESNPELFLGVEVQLPLENNQAKAEYRKAKIGKEKYLVNLKKVERDILRELSNKVAQVNTWADKVKTLRKVVTLQEKKLEAEKARFDYGRSSSDLLIRYQEDLLRARLSLAQALFQYKLSLIDLSLAENILLDKYTKDEL